MKIITLAFLLLLFVGCQTDAARKTSFSGRYQVTLHLPEANKEMEKAKKEVEEELGKAKDEIKEEMAKAKDEIGRCVKCNADVPS
jgi:Skp family chaperone for outer membrane proteins